MMGWLVIFLFLHSLQHNHLPCCKLQVNRAKTAIGQAGQDPNLPRLASDQYFEQSFQCNSPLFNRVAGQVELPAGQVNLQLAPLRKKCFGTYIAPCHISVFLSFFSGKKT